MNTSTTTTAITSTENARLIFEDPVTYLASFGIDCELIATTALPAAA